MTPTRSGSNYSIQSNGSGPGNPSHKRQEGQPRGEAQMEDSRTSTRSQRLASTFETLIESPVADITAIAVRPESLPTGSIRDIAVNHELIFSSEEAHGARKDRGTSEGLDTHVLQRTSTTDKSLVEKPKHVIRGSEKEVGPRQGQNPSGSSPSIHQQNSMSTSSKEAQENPKDRSEGQSKGKGKSKAQVEKALPSELPNSQEREDSHGQFVQYVKNSDGIQKQAQGKIEPIFPR
ncbi:hypothetical protein O181_119537 [Austropuccinia psidii MF-1]|uniref:Uncharacterized protein n=1 Tax=Austropuccinia psidii MF-1 TaxID=1389203 RepID=A0A9Q3KFA3_9BASI|nr:hypothetical protein [Austropuccinia psidii MF-1]